MVIVHLADNQRRVISAKKGETVEELCDRFCKEFNYPMSEFEFQSTSSKLSLPRGLVVTEIKEVRLIRRVSPRKDSSDSCYSSINDKSPQSSNRSKVAPPRPSYTISVQSDKQIKRSAPKPPAMTCESFINQSSEEIEIFIPDPPPYLTPMKIKISAPSLTNSIKCGPDSQASSSPHICHLQSFHSSSVDSSEEDLVVVEGFIEESENINNKCKELDEEIKEGENSSEDSFIIEESSYYRERIDNDILEERKEEDIKGEIISNIEEENIILELCEEEDKNEGRILHDMKTYKKIEDNSKKYEGSVEECYIKEGYFNQKLEQIIEKKVKNMLLEEKVINEEVRKEEINKSFLNVEDYTKAIVEDRVDKGNEDTIFGDVEEKKPMMDTKKSEVEVKVDEDKRHEKDEVNAKNVHVELRKPLILVIEDDKKAEVLKKEIEPNQKTFQALHKREKCYSVDGYSIVNVQKTTLDPGTQKVDDNFYNNPVLITTVPISPARKFWEPVKSCKQLIFTSKGTSLHDVISPPITDPTHFTEGSVETTTNNPLSSTKSSLLFNQTSFSTNDNVSPISPTFSANLTKECVTVTGNKNIKSNSNSYEASNLSTNKPQVTVKEIACEKTNRLDFRPLRPKSLFFSAGNN